jgi:chromosome segregation ATPase
MLLTPEHMEEIKDTIRDLTTQSHASIMAVTSKLGAELKHEIGTMKQSQARQEESQKEMKENIKEVKEDVKELKTTVDGLVIEKAERDGGKSMLGIVGTVVTVVTLALIAVVYLNGVKATDKNADDIKSLADYVYRNR